MGFAARDRRSGKILAGGARFDRQREREERGGEEEGGEGTQLVEWQYAFEQVLITLCHSPS